MATNYHDFPQDLVNALWGIGKSVESLAKTHLDPTDATIVDATFEAILDGKNTSSVFQAWWPLSDNGADDRYTRLNRWFTMLANSYGDKVYTIRKPVYTTTSDGTWTPRADLANKPALKMYIETDDVEDEWVDEDPMFWYIRANALAKEDGTVDIKAIEGIDADFDLYGQLAPVQRFSVALWKAWFTDGTYEYKSIATKQGSGMRPYACDVGLDNEKRTMTWKPCFPGILTPDGKLTSGIWGHGNTQACFLSLNTGLTAARKWNAHTGLQSDTDVMWVKDMFEFLHRNVENSNIMEGCTSYDVRAAVGVAEDATTRVLISEADGAKFYVGSMIEIGTHAEGTGNDRGTAGNRDLSDGVLIKDKYPVTIDGTTYTALELDLLAPINIPATASIATMPWSGGACEILPKHKDGTLFGLTSGKAPIRISGVEVIDGAYAVGGDPLWQVTFNTETNEHRLHVYQCRQASKQAGALTTYTDTGLELVQENVTSNGWKYIKHFKINDYDMLIPDATGGGSTTYEKSGLAFDRSSGLRACWRFAALYHSGGAGLAAASSGIAVSYADWIGRPRLSGSGGNRGEWLAA